ncbi:GTPase-activating protein-like protein of the rho/rac family [Polychaeton citri CBS 116435]|uniref:GTPase-activating protein-like protein of the rho/rac family n=1 Tax=Polychaeton citri CBS 116435 TaxID=1314669 RepID=A0A9P4Q3E6_9PEZI|nr:GTPase-activating protein-like protein of the rho/rac family [Polychaeton citri CBS 116435]
MGLPSEDHAPGAQSSSTSQQQQQQQHEQFGTTPPRERQHSNQNIPIRTRSGDDQQAQDQGERSSRPKQSSEAVANGRRKGSGQQRLCGKCQQALMGQFVRALGDTYHLECFTCHDCDKIVASKFFPVPDQPPGQYPLCETDYFRRLDLLCFACGGALRGSYITALDRKYHIEHFTCSVCPTVFGAQDSYYEHEGSVYCHYHYSTGFAQKCNGCQTAILKQFVEIFRNGVNQHWHPECYMIHKYWNVRLHAAPPKGAELQGLEIEAEKQALAEEKASEEMRQGVRNEEEAVEYKVHWIWQTLSSFEERSATCISDMLLHVSNGAYMDGVVAAKKFISHVDLLFTAADDLNRRLETRPGKGTEQGVRTFDAIVHPGLSYSREAKLLCKKVVAFFQLLAESQDTGVRRLGVTQELLSLVTGLAHYLKLMIRICLSGALKLERETSSAEGLEGFLQDISKLDEKLQEERQRDSKADADAYVDKNADTCAACGKAVEDKCFRKQDRVIHAQCMACAKCSKDFANDTEDAWWSALQEKVFCNLHAPSDAKLGGFTSISRLQQYVHLLRVAHARLLATLRTSGALPHTSDDPNLGGYDSREGHTPGNDDPPLLRSNTRSKSYAGRSASERDAPNYEDTMGDIRRLRSTRMDKQLSSAGRTARKSTIIDGPEGMRPGSADGRPNQRRQTGTFQIVEDRDANGEPINQLRFGNNDAMTLDDIPRIVQAQQTREQRPNASRYARQPMIPQEPKPRLVNGHTRDFSGEPMDNSQIDARPAGTKRYFSELTALEYFIVRHVAVLSMEPLLDGHFNQEELIDLIEAKRPTFWSKFGKAFAPKDKRSKVTKTQIFGVPLEQLLERNYEESTDGVGPGSLKIPSVVQETVSAMKTMDMSVEGVFRKNGNIKRLNDAKEEIDAKGALEMDLTKENPVQVAALLKRFLRELPDPLLTHKLHKLWITSQRIDDSDKRRRLLHLTCCLMPKAHRDTMEVLFTFMNWVSSFSHVDEESGSKMDIHNLATVITPNIIHRGKESMPVDDSFLAIEAVHSLIECNESMCEVPEDLAMILNDSSLFSNSADITTKEILKRYGDRVKPPVPTIVKAPGASTSIQDASIPGGKVMSATDAGGSPQSRSHESNGGRNGTPVAQRVDTDLNQQSAWQNESSVRHVTNDTPAPPKIPYATDPHSSTESYGSGANPGAGEGRISSERSPSRTNMRGSNFDKQRAVGMA